jgi:SAM-dependent methyltransferase
LCGNPQGRNLGEILHLRPATVAGVRINIDDQAFHLVACDECGFQFKSPAVPEEQLLACYRAADSEFAAWISPDPLQRRFDMMRDMLLERIGSSRRILDIGCFHGGFLDYVGADWQRFGIEPSEAASRVSRTKGVTILSPTLSELPASTPPFDAITAMDLIEHLNEPMPFFREVRKRLTDNGVLLLLTGNNDAWQWRTMGSLYWYCSLPEHCSFFSKKSLEYVCREVGYELLEFRTLSHGRAKPVQKVKDVVKNVAYLAARKSGGFGIARMRHAVDRHAPGWLTARDHLVAVLRKR